VTSLDPAAIKFDPIAGYTTIAELNTWSIVNAKRVRMDMGLFAQAFLLVLAEAELVGAQALNQPPNVVNGIPLGLVLGERYSAIKAAPASPARDAYLATMALARSVPNELAPAYANDLEFIPSLHAAQRLSAPGAIVWTVAAVGVPLAAVAALAYWAGKRVDAEASVAVATIQSTTAMDAALKYTLAQGAIGGKVDPEVIKAFQAAGMRGEDARSWAAPTVAAVAGLGLVTGGVMAVRMTGDRKAKAP
jgi:hypothetical protein